MFKFKKNIWLLFYIITFIGTALLITAIYQQYDEILKQTKSEQIYINKVYHNRLNTLFNEHETLHDLIGSAYLHNPNFNNQSFKSVVEINPLLLAISLFSKEGDLQFSTYPDLRVPNLLQNINTQQGFQQALNSDEMLIGKAYFAPFSDQWILPIRKRILDAQGNVSAVMSTILDLTLLHQQWREKNNDQNIIQVTLDNGHFPILRSNLNTQEYAQYYNDSLAGNLLFGQDARLLKSRLKAKNSLYSEAFIQDIEHLKTGKLLYTYSYNPRYNFWTSAEIPYQRVLDKLYQQGFYYFIFYLLLIFIMFILFRWIDQTETSKIAELLYKAEHDTLTGLANHTVIHKHFSEMQKQQATPFALFYLNLDNLHNINKVFGHRYGELILIDVVKRINQSLVGCSMLATRYSSEGFVIVIESDNKDEIAAYAKILLKNIAPPSMINDKEFNISASIGIACFPEDALEIETLLVYAHSSIEKAQKRRNQYQFFSKKDHYQFTRNTEIEQDLRHAIKNEEISIVYQPQLDKNKTLFGVEALVRWNSKKLGFIGPDEFIPIAEKMGYMPQLGLYIMHRAMQEIARLKKQEKLAFKLAINVSAKQFVRGDFIKRLIEACTIHAIDPGTITIEITESLFIERLDDLLPLFNKIKANAFSLSLDDFGTGYSSLNMLRKVPVDELKIDKSFVDNIVSNDIDYVIVENIITMSKALGLKIVAEGAEDKQQVALLKKAGCDIFQGYYFSKPLSLEALRTFAQDNKRTTTSQPQIRSVR